MQKAERMPYHEFAKLFPDDDTCLQYVWDTCHGDMVQCPKCEKSARYYRIKKRKQYACSQCAHQIAPLAGTIFHHTKLPLSIWFYALYLFSINKNGISAKELERVLGVTYETAWSMLKRIRELAGRGTHDTYFMDGVAEIDDAYFGGKVGNLHAKERAALRERHGSLYGKSGIKTTVIGAVSRGDVKQAQAEVLDTKAPTLQNTDNFIDDTINRDKVKVITDDWTAYMKLRKRGVLHAVVAHGRGEYCRTGKNTGLPIHTNNIENLWSQIKRSLDGTYHHVSRKYLQHYLDEFVFRYNHRGRQVFFSLLPLLPHSAKAKRS